MLLAIKAEIRDTFHHERHSAKIAFLQVADFQYLNGIGKL